jgi:hypothetical protein
MTWKLVTARMQAGLLAAVMPRNGESTVR